MTLDRSLYFASQGSALTAVAILVVNFNAPVSHLVMALVIFSWVTLALRIGLVLRSSRRRP